MENLSNLSDQEQIEVLKKWWKNNGVNIITGIVLGVSGIAGWQFFTNYQTKTQIELSKNYESILKESKKIDEFITNNSNSIYAVNLALIEASKAVKTKQYPIAIKHLLWVIDNAGYKSYQLLARINLAKIYLEQNKPNQTIDTLAAVKDYQTFSAESFSVLGDALVKIGNIEKAKIVYQKSLTEFSDNDYLKNIVQLKINNL